MRFALIYEGISEYQILKQLLYKYFKDPEPWIRPISPEINNDSQQTVGGWHEVLKYCSLEKLNSVCAESDYVIIQIDSDQCENKAFGVSKINSAGKSKSVQELSEDIAAKIRSLIIPEILAKHDHKIIIAVCVETIECWLLPIVHTDNKAKRIYNCITVLNDGLRVRKMAKIPADKNSKPARIAYEAILSKLKSRKDVDAAAKHNYGFQKFISCLKTIPQAK